MVRHDVEDEAHAALAERIVIMGGPYGTFIHGKALTEAGKSEAKAVPLADLDGEPFILRDPASATRQVFEKALARAGVKVRAVLESNSREAVREAVGRGMGLGVVSEREHAPHSAIRLIAIEGAEMWTAAYVCCLAARRKRPMIEAFMGLAQSTRAT